MARVVLEQDVVGGVTNYVATPTLFNYSVTYDANAQNFFNAVGGGLSSSESNAVNTFVVNAKGHSYYTNLVFFYPMVGGTSNTTKYDLVSHTAGTWNGTLTYASSGVTSDGSTGYLDTGAIPSVLIVSLSVVSLVPLVVVESSDTFESQELDCIHLTG